MAALQKTPFTLQLGSLRTDVDPHLLPPNAGVLELENCVINTDGAASKRNGNVALSNTLTPSGAMPATWQLATHKGALLSVASGLDTNSINFGSVSAFSSAENKFNKLQRGVGGAVSAVAGHWGATQIDIGGGASQGNNHDIAFANGYAAICYEIATITNSILFQIIDLATGKTVFSVQNFGFRPRVLSLNGFFVFVYIDPSQDAGNGLFVFVRFATSDPTSSVGTVSSASTGPLLTSPWFDIAADGSDNISLAYYRGDFTVWGMEYTVSTGVCGARAQLKDAAVANIPASQCLGWCTDIASAGRVLIIADVTQGIRGHQFTNGTMTVATSTVIDAAATANIRNVTGLTTAATSYVVLYEVTGTNPWNTKTKGAVNAAGGVSLSVWQEGVGLRSKPQQVSGQTVVVCSVDSTRQATNFLLPVVSGSQLFIAPTPLARMQTWNAAGKTEKVSALSSLVVSSGSLLCALTVRERLETASGGIYFDYGTALMQFTPAPTAIGTPREAHGCTYVPGGVLTALDGSHLFEHNWHIYPDGLSVAYSAAAGNLVAGQTYNWIVVFRWINGQGQIVRSATSPVLTGTVTAGNNTATITVPYARLTTVPNIVAQIELYRTIAGGTTYFKDTQVSNSRASTGDQTITDTLSDAALSAGELLYAQPGGALASQPSPPTSFIETYDRRLWAISSEDPALLWFTNQFVDGIAPIFNEVLVTSLRDQYGACTALAPMDNKLIVFKERAIYMIYGSGPDTLGNGGYQAPQLVAIGDGVASTQVRSVISTSDGIYFLSNKGLCLLTRGLAVQYIGKPMQNYTGSFVCTGVVLMPDVTQIRWFSAAGTTIVYDYIHQVWGIHTGQPTSSVVIWNGVPVMADVAGANRYVETAGTYLERGANYGQKITFPWLSLAGLRGFQRLYRVQGIGSCTNFSTLISCTFVYDFDDTTAHAQTMTPTDALWTWEARPARQVATAYKLKITGAAAAGNGFTCAGLTLVYGRKKGLQPIDKAKRAV